MRSDQIGPLVLIERDLETQITECLLLAENYFFSWEEHPEYAAALNSALATTREEIRNLSREKLLKLLTATLTTAILHAELKKAYIDKGEFRGALLLGHGTESIGVGITEAALSHYLISPTHRDLSAYVARGTPLKAIWANHLMRSNSPGGGCDPNVHFGDLERNILGFLVSDMAMSAVQTNGAVCSVNRTKAHKKGRELTPEELTLGIAILGDGASSTGLAHEGMNFAKAWPLPILFVIQNNQIALSTNAQQEHGGINLANRAVGYEMPFLSLDEATVNGDDVYAVYFATRLLLTFIRATGHPALLHLKTFRRGGHNDSESTEYIKEIFGAEKVEFEQSIDRLPIARARVTATKLGIIDNASYEELRDRTRKEVEHAHQEALAETLPDPAIIFADEDTAVEEQLSGVSVAKSVRTDETRNALIDPHCETVRDLAAQYPPENAGERHIIRMREAISDALREEFDHDPLLFLIGEDVEWPKGGIFAVTKPLADNPKYRDRLKNTPISEGAIGGFVVGAGMMGGHVVAEFQFWNFFQSSPSPILTLAATRPFMQRYGIPGVLRGPTGYSPQSNHYHETWPETSLLNTLGIKVVVPSTPEDMKGLLKSAIRDPNLVAFLEEISGYNMRGEVPVGEYFTPFIPAVRREGEHITLIAWGPKMLGMALDAANELMKESISLEVIDLRVLHPLDTTFLVEHVERTGRVIILHEDKRFMGLGAEILAQISERMSFYTLKARPLRIAALNTPIPAELGLENHRLPNIQKIVRAAKVQMEESL